MTFGPPIGIAAALAGTLGVLVACADPSVSLDQKMSQIRRQQCEPLPSEARRSACIEEVNNLEDEAQQRIGAARQRQAVQQAVDEVRVINQTTQGW